MKHLGTSIKNRVRHEKWDTRRIGANYAGYSDLFSALYRHQHDAAKRRPYCTLLCVRMYARHCIADGRLWLSDRGGRKNR